MSIAHNLLVNWYRDRGRRPPTEALDAALQVPSTTPGPESSLEQHERIARVRRAISALAPDRQRLITLKYVDGKVPVVSGLKRVSKPGRRVYKGADELPKVLGGFGVAIISTSRGLMTDKEAREGGHGGEVLCTVS